MELGARKAFVLKVLHPRPLPPSAGCLGCIKRQLFRVGDDWYFLFALGIVMALVSFAMDFTVSRVTSGELLPRQIPQGGTPSARLPR